MNQFLQLLNKPRILFQPVACSGFKTFTFIVLASLGVFAESYGQSCNGANGTPVTGGVLLNANGDICANSAVLPGQITITAGNVDDVNNPALVKFSINWDDGTAAQVVSAPTVVWGGVNSHSYSAVVTHLFPPNGGAVKCQYKPVITLVVNNVSCGSLGTPPTFVRWNTDDQLQGGLLRLSEQVTDVTNYQICAGYQFDVYFQDRSTLNCMIAFAPTFPNVRRRFRQYIYGTGASTIAGVKVANVAVGYPFNGPVLQTLDAGVTSPPVPTLTDKITIPASATLGQFFEITMNEWDYCNTYPANAPKVTTARVTIIGAPPAPTTAGLTLCYGSATGGQNFNITASAAPNPRTAVNWYNTDPRVFGSGFIKMTNPNGGNSTNFPLTAYTSGANGAVGGTATGVNTSRGGGAGAVYSVWATQVYGGTNPCESQPVEVVLTVKPQLTTPGAITGANQICVGTINEPYSLGAAAPGKSIPATTFTNAGIVNFTTQYLWSFTNGNAAISGSTTAQNTTANFTAAGATTIQVDNRYTTAPNCATTPSTLNITIDPTSVPGSIGQNPTICAGSPTGNMVLTGKTGNVLRWERQPPAGVFTAIAATAGLTTFSETPTFGNGVYHYRAVVQSGVCAAVNSASNTVTVNPVPSKPVITDDVTSTGRIICDDGVQKTVLKSDNGGSGVTYLWFKNGVSTGITINTVTLTDAVQSGDYTVQVFGVGPSNCPSPPSDPVTVTIHDTPSATVVGGGSVCSGTPAPDIVWTLTGATPFTLRYTDGTTIFGPFVVAGPTYTVPGPTVPGNYTLVSLSDNNLCSATATGLGGIATVTVQAVPPPTVEAFTAGPAVCDGGGATVPPVALLDLLPNAVANYSITFTLKNLSTLVTGGPITGTYAATGTGLVTLTPTYAQMGSGPEPLGYQIIITSIFNTLTLCAGAVPINGPTLIINPRPPTATNPVNTQACSVPNTGVAMSVDDPDPGNTLNRAISWSKGGPALASFVAVTGADGAVSGTHNRIFTPATAQTQTFYAFVLNNATGCLSANGIPVTQTRDIKPTAANAGPDQPNLCSPGTAITATPADNGGTGTWSSLTAVGFGSPVTNANNSVTTLPQDPPGGGARATTVTWTVTSALGVCPPSSKDVILTTHPLPTIVVIAPALCDDAPGLPFQAANINLNSYNAQVTNAPTVQWYTSPLRTPPFLISTPITVNNGDTFYFTATSVGPFNCTNTGQTTFAVNALPAAIDKSFEFCENSVGFGSATGINLTTFEMGAGGVTNGGTAATRDVEWYEDNGSGGLGALIVAETSYSITALKTVHAKVIDLTSPVIPKCFDIADVILKFKKKPVDNPITGSTTICTGNTIQIFQVNPATNTYTNAGVSPTTHTYNWTITPAPVLGSGIELVAGGGTNSTSFFVLMKFDGGYTGNVTFTAQENVDNCSGNIASFVLNVAGASPPLAFVAPKTQVCKDETTSYSVAGASGIYTWTVVGGAVSGANSGPDLKTISVNWGSLTFPQPSVSVTQVNAAGCTGAPASINVFLNDFPVMTSSGTSTVCSGGTPGLVFTSSVNPATFSWRVTSITGAITGTSVGTTGTGDLGATFTGASALKNFSGAVGSVAFDVTPAVTAPPNCQGVPQSVVLTVNPEPTLASPQTKTVCSGIAVNYEILLSPANLPAGTQFDWAKPVMSNGSNQGVARTNVPTGAPGTPHITDVLVNTSNTTITALYTVTPHNTLTGCVGSPNTVMITVNPEPVMSSSLDGTRCSDITLGLTLATAAGSVAANNYNITARTIDVGLTAGTNAAVPASGVSLNYLANDTYNNITNAQHFVSYTVVPVSVAGCAGAPKIITFTINPEPVLSNLLDASVCSDVPIGLTMNTNGSSIGAAVYKVTGRTVAPGLVAGGSNVTVPANNVAANYLAGETYTNTGNVPLTVVYLISPVSAATCEGNPPVPVTVTILPEPVVSSGLNASVCSRSAIGLTLNTNGTSIAALNYSITSRVIDPGLVAGGTNAVVPAAGVGPGYLSGDVFTNTGPSPLNVAYTVVPKSAGPGCSGDSRVITITVNPEPVMSSSLDATLCSDLLTGLILSTNGTSVGAANYNITARSISGGLTPNISNVGVPATGVAANYLSNDNFNNVGATSLTVTYTVVPVSATGCLGIAKIITITIDPEPVVSPSLDNTVCSEVPIGLILNTNGSSVASISFDITSRSISAGLTANGGNATIPALGVGDNYLSGDIYFNLTGAAHTVTYTVVPNSATGCSGNARVITMTVSPEPILSNTLDASVCSGLATGLTLNTNGTSIAASNFNITARTIPGGLTAAPGNAVVPANGVVVNYLTNDKFTNTGTLPLVVTYTVVPISASGCPGPTKDIFITINPEPVVSPSLNANICSDVPTGLTLATNGSSIGAATYNILSRSVGGGLVVGVGNAATPANGVSAGYLAADVFTNTTTLPITVTYTVVPVSAALCSGAAKIITLTIDPEPVVSNTLNTGACSHLAIGLTLSTNGTSVAAANYNIISRSIAPGLIADGGNAPIASGVVPGYLANDKFTNTGALPLNVTYTVVPVSAAGCLGDQKVITVIITPEPVVSSTLDRTVCSDAIVGLTLATDGISVAASNYDIISQSVSVGLTPALSNVVVPATGVGTGYLNGNKYNNVTNAPLTVSYTVEPVSAGGCHGAPTVIIMTINPEPVLSSSLNLTVCSDLPTGLSLNTNGTSVAAQNYNITNLTVAPGLSPALGNAVVPASGVNLGYLGNDKFTNTGAVALTATYTVVPVSAAGCAGDPVSVVITIDPKPVVSATLSNTICSGSAIGLTLNTNGTSVAAANYNIVNVIVPAALTPGASNAAFPANGVVAGYLVNDVYTNTSATPLNVTYTVVPVSAIGCIGDSRVITMTINPEPVVANGLDATVCSDAATGLTLNTNGSSVGAASYNITVRTIDPALTPAGANATAPSTGVLANYLAGDKFTNTTALPHNVVYTVVPVSSAGCLGQPKVITIIVNPEPVTASGLDAFICSDIPVALTLNTNGTSIAAASYNIVSRTVTVGLVGNGANAVVPATGVAANYLINDSFTNTTSSSLTVAYVVVPASGAGCLGDQKTITMTIRPEPVISNGLDGTKCSGIATGFVLATNGSSVPAASYNVTAINAAAGLTPAATNAGLANGVAPNYLAGDIFTNTGALPLNVTYTVVPVSGTGCEGDPKNITFTINPQPEISPALDATVCSDNAIGLTLNTNGTSVGAATYNITSVVVSPALTPSPGNAIVPANGVVATYAATDKFTNTTNADATVVYNVVGISAASCIGNPLPVTITIRPEPVLASNLNKTVCSDALGGIALNTNATSVGAASYNITAVTVPAGLVVVSAAAIPANAVAANYLATDSYTNPGNTTLEVLYTVVPVSAAGCLGDPLVVKQIVTPEPVLANLNKAVCSDAAIALTLATSPASVAASNYNVTAITIAGGLTAAVTNVAIPGTGVTAAYLANDQFTNHGNLSLDVRYTVVPVSAIGCLGDPVVVVITINPEPVLSIALNRTVCSDLASGVTLNTDGISVAAATYNITSIVVSGGLTPKAGNAAVANGQAAGYLSGDIFTNKSNGSLTVTYTVIPVSAGNCLGDPLDVVLTVDPEPVMDPALATKTVCSRDITNITLNTNGSSVVAATYNITLVSQDAGLTGVPTTGPALSASAILNDKFINVTTIPLKVIYQVVPVSGGGCLGDPFNISVTVNAEPVINPALDNTVCSREIAGIILSTNGTSVAATSYQLVSVTVPGTIAADPANTIPGTASGINLIRNDKYTNTTAGPVVVTYSVFGISPQSCQGQPQAILLTINPEPILSPGTANLCSDIPSGIILNPAAGSAPISQYTLKSIAKAAALVAGPTNAGLGTYNTNNFLAGDQFTNTTNGPLVVTYTIAPVAAGCVGIDQTVVFTVNPAPAVASNLNKTVCTNELSGIVLATETSPLSAPASTYNIVSVTLQAGLTQTAGNTGARVGVSANEIQNDQFQNPSNNALTVTYRVEALSGSGCLGPRKDVILTIEPTIKAAPVNNKPTICSNDVTNIDLVSPSIPTSGAISFNYTAVSSVGGLISGFVPVASNLPANTKIIDNLVNNSPSPATVTYSVTAVANGAKGGSGCIGTPTMVIVTVEPKPKMTATPAISTVCEGSATAIALTTTTVPSAGTIHFNIVSTVATGGMTLTSAAPPAFYTNGQSITDVWNNPTTVAQTVTYTLQPVVSGGLGCVGDQVTVTANINPLPTLTSTPQAPICSNDFINITLTSDVANTINTWTAAVITGTVTGAGPGAGDLIFQTLKNTGTIPATVRYTVTPKATNCFGTPLIIDVVVNPLADAASVPPTQKVCYGGTLNVPLTSSVAGATFAWVVDPFPNSMGVAQTGSGPVINQVLSNPTGAQDFLTYTITATGPGATACSSQPKIMQVVAAPQMNAAFLNPDTWLCKGSKDFLQIQIDGQAPFELVYSDGTTNFTLTNVGNFKSIQVQPLATTTYHLVSMKDAFGCSLAPVSQVVFTVGDTDATFSVVGATSSCSPYQVTLQYNQKAGTEYTWRWGDGVADSVYIAAADVSGVQVKHTYTNSSPSSTLKPKIVLQTALPAPFPGCFKSTTQTINVFPKIVTNIFPDKTEMCSGELVRFTNQSFGVTIHRWFYRVQGTTQEIDVRATKDVSYTLDNTLTTNPNPIIYEVVYQSTNGNCPAADIVTPITVYHSITPGFDEGIVPDLTAGHSIVTFNNTSDPIDPVNFTYDWDFGLDASPATFTGPGPVVVDFTSAGPRDVVLTVTNNTAPPELSCGKQFSKSVLVPVKTPTAGFVAIPPASCFPASITVTENNSTNADEFEWKLIDNNGKLAATSNADLPVFQVNSSGKFTLSLKATNSVTGQVAVAPIQTFTVFDRPLASFEVRPDIVYVPDTELTTFNFSFGATDYLWDFGDGVTSTATDTTHIYTTENKYNIKLIAMNDHGDGVICADTLVREVVAKQGGLTKVPNAFTPNTNGPNGGVSTNNSFNDVFLPIVKGVEEFNMQIFDRWGNLLFESNSSSIGWDGYNKDGRLMPAGVYVYKLTVRLSDNQRSTQIGDVTMIR